jgi:hypothetical protein
MLSVLFLALGTLLVNAQQPSGGAVNTLTASESAGGWTLLFDGKSIADWVPSGEADWRVEDGTITSTKGSGFLAAPKPLKDFEFKADFWVDKTANSGVFIRCADNPIRAQGCYEVNIFDAHEQWPTGSINNLKTVLPDKPNTTEKWNTIEITAKGTNLIVKVNGATTVDVKDERRADGTLALQQGGAGASGVVRFRNVKLRAL